MLKRQPWLNNIYYYYYYYYYYYHLYKSTYQIDTNVKMTITRRQQQQQSLFRAQKFIIDKYTQGKNINNKKMSTAT